MDRENISKEENQIIVRSYRSLMRTIRDKTSVKEKAKIRLACDMAINAHKNTKRKSKLK